MPRASRVLVKLALLHLLAGASLGALLLAGKGVPRLALLPWTWRAAHVELLAIGFTVQLAMGVAFWILPRDADRPPSATCAWIACALVNAGVALAAWGGATAGVAGAVGGRALEALAVAIFAAHAWPRVRAAREIIVPGGSPGRSR